MVNLNDQKTAISDSEWEVMRIVWTLKEADTNTIIAQLQAKKDWSASTIKTLLARLVKKECLKTSRAGRQFVYCACISQVELMVQAGQELLERMCDMHKGEVILELIQSSPISQKDLQKIVKLAQEKAKTAPEVVKCNCLSKTDKCC